MIGDQVEDIRRHLDDIEGCEFTEVITSTLSTSYVTINGDRYTVSRRSPDGLTLYLKCV
jgi:hypothetical protein